MELTQQAVMWMVGLGLFVVCFLQWSGWTASGSPFCYCRPVSDIASNYPKKGHSCFQVIDCKAQVWMLNVSYFMMWSLFSEYTQFMALEHKKLKQVYCTQETTSFTWWWWLPWCKMERKWKWPEPCNAFKLSCLQQRCALCWWWRTTKA